MKKIEEDKKFKNNDLIIFNCKNSIAIITLNNPPLNLLNVKMQELLEEYINRIYHDNSIRCVVITGKGNKSFCAGSDVNDFIELLNSGKAIEIIEKKLKKVNQIFDLIENFPQPTIAALNGYTLGGGLELAVCCDLRIIARNAKIGMPEIKLGLPSCAGGLIRITKIIGESKAKELFFLGKSLTGELAFEWGLVNEFVPDGDALAAAMKMAEKISNLPSKSMKYLKRGIRTLPFMEHGRAIEENLACCEELFKTYDAMEGIKSFLEKRKPIFKHI